MIVISKPLFDSRVGPEVTCRSVLHPWTNSCSKGVLSLIGIRCLSGIFYFYLSVYLVKLLTDRKKLNKIYLRKIVRKFLCSWCYGASYAVLLVGGICLNYKILGAFHYYTFVLLPGFLAGLSLLFEDDENRLLNTLLWSSMLVEALLKNCYHFQVIKYSVVKETLLFMLVSALLMHVISKRTLNGRRFPPSLWIYFPHAHKEEFALKSYALEIVKYFGVGFGLSSARSLVSGAVNLKKDFAKSVFRAIFNQKNAKFGMVIGAYAALFKGSFVILQKYNHCNETTNAALAGLVAGLSYYIKPTSNILAIATVTLVQMLLKEFLKASRSTKQAITILFYMFSNGVLVQNRILAPGTCPQYYVNMLKVAANGLVEEIYVRLLNEIILKKDI